MYIFLDICFLFIIYIFFFDNRVVFQAPKTSEQVNAKK